ncbi:ATP-binding protein, partial [Hyalangium sp.]|uniref:ATP-binding protein n=1 Tax=Hyalangium sp. TaxID=2028555 RepID=UPI002D5DBAE3
MKSTSPTETKPSAPEAAGLEARSASPWPPQRWLLTQLDRFLSQALRRASPSDLSRARLTVGATIFLFLFVLSYQVQTLLSAAGLQGRDLAVGLSAMTAYAGVLVLMRRAATIRVPALLLCAVLTLALVGSIFTLSIPLGGTHAAVMLLPALSVYLLGPRWGFPITLFLIAVMGFAYPLYLTRPGSGLEQDSQFWGLYLFGSISFLGAWGLGALHSAARDEVQLSLERTLKEKRESEGKLISLFESTGDLICSLDLEGRLITANSALKQLLSRNYGRVLAPGESLLNTLPPANKELWSQRLGEVASGQSVRFEEEYLVGDKRTTYETGLSPIPGEGGQIVGATVFSRDVSARKEVESRLGEMHRTLVDVSRQAGMAEIATGVLHNVGNTLNSVNISTAMLADLLRKSRVSGLAKAAQLLREHTQDLAAFLSSDPQGQKLSGYFIALSESLVEEREAMSREVLSLTESVEHIKSVVSMQQRHARTGGAVEELQVPQLIDEALRLHAVSFERLGIAVEREYAAVVPISLDRHKLLQILINLLSNARHALVDSQTQAKRLAIRVRPSSDGARLLIEVADNGMGIAPENLSRIFTQGFTTKKTGHGFGLHISALAATEMKGRLTCASPGPGQGATFTLELPLAGEE